jgi:hypothetical protein
MIECGRRFAATTDDGVSDATTIALALSLRCGREYDRTTEAAAATLDNDAQRRMFRQRRAARAERIETFLAPVMQARQQRIHQNSP